MERILEIKNYKGLVAELPAKLNEGDTFDATDGGFYRCDKDGVPQVVGGGDSTLGATIELSQITLGAKIPIATMSDFEAVTKDSNSITSITRLRMVNSEINSESIIETSDAGVAKVAYSTVTLGGIVYRTVIITSLATGLATITWNWNRRDFSIKVLSV